MASSPTSRTDEPRISYQRFVALGDSQTEGLWDGDDETGLGGWADRFADRLAADNPGIRYANLAVRGRRLAEVRDEQLDAALALGPDLVGFCAGMNDVTAPRGDLAQALDIMEELYAKLTASGATVVTTLFPDARLIVPLAARLIGPRVELVNDRIRLCAQRYDLRLVDLYGAASMSDLRMWSPDRLHGSPEGHLRFALAVAEALGLDGADHSWAQAPEGTEQHRAAGVAGELAWLGATVRPWVWRRLRGRSTGDGRTAKRPDLLPVRD
ncbi:SGNH/GDSL hydrolase family protein [Nocardia vermiculata]|uniref:SGNH/GDSL hydrolase family protein n=1 Tax=Nocardia vermiculata TaxID=257274 RepID=A0A846XUT5_9NOCA|nr:SGNH/GDSL hydrolase family protein [Nocardia vermiculata]NKY49620.1 SGNH/GDSL hydrolase family protein [Nocardia vermiculata]